MVAKLHFLVSVARDCEWFLREYQTAKPMAPFLYDDCRCILSSIMYRIVSPTLLDNVKSVAQLVTVDLSEDSIALIPLKAINLGVASTTALNGADVPHDLKKQFRSNCQKLLRCMAMKLIERWPLKHKLTRFISCIVPKKLLNNKQTVRST
jgi:hypothetical protein